LNSYIYKYFYLLLIIISNLNKKGEWKKMDKYEKLHKELVGLAMAEQIARNHIEP